MTDERKPPVPDAELIAAARRGDLVSAEALLARHERQIYRFGLRMCGNEADAKDVLQETLLAAFKNLREFRADASLSTWLFQIARSFCTKSRRRQVGEPAEPVPLEAPEVLRVEGGETPDVKAHAKEIAQTLEAAILSLPANQREVILLRDVEGLSAEEAARVVGIEVGALKSRLHRARLELRTRLSAAMSETPSASPCPALAEELSAFAASEIDQSVCARIGEHLEQCEHCAKACEDLRQTVAVCHALPEGEVPGPIRAVVRAALREAAGAKLAPEPAPR